MLRQFLLVTACAVAPFATLAQDDGVDVPPDFQPLDVIEGPIDEPEDQVFEENVPFDEYGNPIAPNPDDPNAPLRPGEGETVTTVQEGPEVVEGTGANIRGLDKLSGKTVDLSLKTGETGEIGWLQITLGDCRYPTDNPVGDAFAHLVIRENNDETPLFDAWMVASSPALSALDHARFDVWVMRCTTE
ncbi:DUF2155 domain-containing protein [uncultured Maritimibacter sp.]|jgi:hypothetical protein|uniref:DUF2155 domain-containing protein n=1 Tax=uncultured Maritimibacter sp. TaxID=991866 RepID=UPI000A3DD0CB|nr:DUF2155 domain-containing protein [uncultured Maritimibacter sp.]